MSDPYNIYACKTCGLLACGSHEKKTFFCKSCRKNRDVFMIQMPYASKQMLEELICMHIVPRLSLDYEEEEEGEKEEA